MSIHKFIHKQERPPATAVTWIPHAGLAYPQKQLNRRWAILTQQSLTVNPKWTITLSLGFGVQLFRGVCSISLRQALKEKQLSLHDGFIAETVEDIIITIQNNSSNVVNIAEGESLCFIMHNQS